MCQQLTVNRTRPLLKWNTVIKWKAMRSLTLTSGKWANDRQNIKIYIEPSESILEDLFEQQPLHTIVAAWTMCWGGRQAACHGLHKSLKRKRCFCRLLLPSGSVAKLTELPDNKIISAQDQLYYFLDWTTLLTPVIVSLNRHGFFLRLYRHFSSRKTGQTSYSRITERAATTAWKYIL